MYKEIFYPSKIASYCIHNCTNLWNAWEFYNALLCTVRCVHLAYLILSSHTGLAVHSIQGAGRLTVFRITEHNYLTCKCQQPTKCLILTFSDSLVGQLYDMNWSSFKFYLALFGDKPFFCCCDFCDFELGIRRGSWYILQCCIWYSALHTT